MNWAWTTLPDHALTAEFLEGYLTKPDASIVMNRARAVWPDGFDGVMVRLKIGVSAYGGCVIWDVEKDGAGLYPFHPAHGFDRHYFPPNLRTDVWQQMRLAA